MDDFIIDELLNTIKENLENNVNNYVMYQDIHKILDKHFEELREEDREFYEEKIAELENDVDYWQDRALEAESNLEDEDTFWDSAYLVSNYDEIIGYLAIFMDAKEAELHYAVVPEFRGIRNNSNETIGCQIVREASIGLFRRCKSLKYLKLMIEKSNIRSTKTALRAGYKQVEKGFYNKFTLSREDAMSL